MKRRRRDFTLIGAFLFFLSIATMVTVSMLIYGYVDEKSGGDRAIVSLVMLLVIVFLSIVTTLLDLVRRHIMVDKPVEKILSATEKITSGDFSVYVEPIHGYGKYDEFDVIMENLNTLAAELSKTEVLKTDFVSNVSHELKTPLAIIRNYAMLLQKDGLTDEERKKYAQVLVDTSGRLADLVANILKLNKLENRKILPEKERIRLDESLAEAVIGLEDLIDKKGLELDCDLDEISVLSVAGYLEIVWNNLLSNAIKFTDAGGRVALTLKNVNGNAVVTVSDSGCGIDPETGKRIFDKFYQGDTSHAKEGNGLGLALVKRVIDVLGGEISVESELGKGSTFTIVLKGVVS